MTLHATYRPVRPQRPHHARKRATTRPRAGEKSCNQRLSFAAEKPQPRLHCSQQFSTVALTTSSAAIAERYAFSAYGAPTVCNASGTDIGASTKDNRITYTGREWDEELVLYHFRARLYDAGVGRFCSRDPIGYEGSPWNLYEQMGGQSISMLDPSGELYGRYCGFLRTGPGFPVDDLDAACQSHDTCLATWVEFCIPLRRRQCDTALCHEAIRQFAVGCNVSPTPGQCRQAAAVIMAVMCQSGGQVAPPTFPHPNMGGTVTLPWPF
jgi:RHS repeat-associated protein